MKVSAFLTSKNNTGKLDTHKNSQIFAQDKLEIKQVSLITKLFKFNMFSLDNRNAFSYLF